MTTTPEPAAPTAPPSTHSTEAPGPHPERPGYRHRWVILYLVLAGEVVDLVDSTIVTIAAPTIRGELGGSPSTMQWYLAAYTLAFAVALVTCARLGDILGRKTMFIAGMAGFTCMSLLCGVAVSPEMLIGCRVLQGLFGAVMIPQGLALIKAAFPPAEISKAFTAFGPVMGLSAVLGPILAGVLLDANLFGTGWRMIFLVNIPVGVLALLGAARYMPQLRPSDHAQRLDPVGVGLLTVASAMLIYPLVQGHELGWPIWTFALMACSLLVFALFVLSERRSADPVIEPSLFRNRAFTGGLVVILTMFVAFTGFILVFNLFTQLGLGFGPLHAGLTMVPWSVGIAIGAGLSGAWLGPAYGRQVLHAGFLVVAAGLVGVWLTLQLCAGGVTAWDMVPALLVSGLGSGLIFAPMFDIILAGVGDREVGSASGLLTAFQQYGGAIGVAVVGTIFFELLPAHLFLGSMKAVSLIAAALFCVSFCSAFLLPKHARQDPGTT
ncbi:MAG: DHA2 family efflux MFS transporter permease subunit [Nocardioidaceae bacterium]